MKSIEITDKNHEIIESTDAPLLLDFYAPWCGACKSAAPLIERTLERNENLNLKLCRINVDESPYLAGKYRVMSIPTLIMLTKDGGKMRLTGVGSEGRLQDFINTAK